MASVAGALVRRLRMDAGINMNQLARVLGRDARYVSDIENGNRELELFEFIAFAKALNQDSREMLRQLQVDFAAARQLRSLQSNPQEAEGGPAT